MSDNIVMAFSQDNARTEENDYLIDNFIATDKFWRIFSPKHQILFGSRGSGKTAITKMASFPFLKSYDNEHARTIVKKLDFVGVFVNTDIRFVGSLKNKQWTNQLYSEKYFVWKFNINCLKSLAITVESIFKHMYGDSTDKILREKRFVDDVTEILFKKRLNLRLSELPDYISDYEFKVREAINTQFLSGTKDFTALNDSFSTEILEPIQFVLRVVRRIEPRLHLTNWLLLVDEAEFLTEAHHEIINSLMRTNPEKLYIKMATLPYHHHTLSTNINVHLQPDDDFEYLYLDADPIYDLNSKSRYIYSFAKTLFTNRITNYLNKYGLSESNVDTSCVYMLENVLGASPFEQPKKLPNDINEAINKLSTYLDEKSISRARDLASDRDKFGNEIWRKVSGIICLIDDRKRAVGNAEMYCYSGVETVIRCTDGVPRRMINMYQDIAKEIVKVLSRGLHDANTHSRANPILKGKAQTRIMKSFSEKRFMQSNSVPGVGPELYEFIDSIGRYISFQLHKEKLSTDIIGSFKLDSNTSDHYWNMVRCGVAYGFIFPNISDRHPDRLVGKRGSFRLSFALCPKFDTFPRRGTARLLQGMLRAQRRNEPLSKTSIEQIRFDF